MPRIKTTLSAASEFLLPVRMQPGIRPTGKLLGLSSWDYAVQKNLLELSPHRPQWALNAPHQGFTKCSHHLWFVPPQTRSSRQASLLQRRSDGCLAITIWPSSKSFGSLFLSTYSAPTCWLHDLIVHLPYKLSRPSHVSLFGDNLQYLFVSGLMFWLIIVNSAINI